MPMMPSALAISTYGVVKFVGYMFAAVTVNRISGIPYSPLKFPLLKISFGLLASSLLFFSLLALFSKAEISDWQLFALGIPIRFLVWLALLKYCWKNLKAKELIVLGLVGVLYSCLLDFVMYVFFKLMPGMQSPWC
jgi:hypothetical protein